MGQVVQLSIVRELRNRMAVMRAKIPGKSLSDDVVISQRMLRAGERQWILTDGTGKIISENILVTPHLQESLKEDILWYLSMLGFLPEDIHEHDVVCDYEAEEDGSERYILRTSDYELTFCLTKRLAIGAVNNLSDFDGPSAA